MVEQDGLELFEVLGEQQGFYGAFWEFRESVVGWGKNGEGSFAFERIDQIGGAKGGSEGCEAAISHGGVDNVNQLGRGQQD